MMKAGESIMEEWRRRLDVIRGDLINVHYYRMIYREVCLIVDANPAIQKPSSFHVLLGSGYVTMAFITIRRQASGVKWDKEKRRYVPTGDPHCISLARLLIDISARPQEISRQHFREANADRGLSETRIDQEFEAAGIPAGRDSVERETVISNLTTLMKATESVHGYADRQVAHIDERGWTGAIPTFGELDDAIDGLASVCRKYSKLLGRGDIHFQPVLRPGWKEILKVP